jgi:hypothetical protein
MKRPLFYFSFSFYTINIFSSLSFCFSCNFYINFFYFSFSSFCAFFKKLKRSKIEGFYFSLIFDVFFENKKCFSKK